jgi:hypothetical protein
LVGIVHPIQYADSHDGLGEFGKQFPGQTVSSLGGGAFLDK